MKPRRTLHPSSALQFNWHDKTNSQRKGWYIILLIYYYGTNVYCWRRLETVKKCMWRIVGLICPTPFFHWLFSYLLKTAPRFAEWKYIRANLPCATTSDLSIANIQQTHIVYVLGFGFGFGCTYNTMCTVYSTVHAAYIHIPI